MRRLAYLMEKDYTDKDCKRFLKRLRREFYHLFSHVIYGIDWHNSKAERAVLRAVTPHDVRQPHRV